MFFDKKKSVQPIRFEKIDFYSLGLEENYRIAVEKISIILRKDVCWRFKNLNRETYEIYNLNRKDGKVYFSKSDIILLRQYSDVLFSLINYRWAQMLEGFNYSPRISRKVRSIDEDNIRRTPLKKFHKHLDLMFDDGIRRCFYCGEKIEEDQISVDHVIPWSYMFSDDLWNLVYCHKGENSEKSNRLPSEREVARLEERNMQLLQRMKNTSKDYDQLQIAVEKGYVKKFWVAFKG